MVLESFDLAENKPLKLKDVPIPQINDEEVLIKLRACGVCHTDLHTIEGDIKPPHLPIIPGHEIIGVIEDVGKNVKNFKKGDRVGIPWLYSSCGKCKYCKMGLENLCPDAKFTGFHVNGGYAEYVKVNQNFTYPIPDNYDDVSAAPLMCAGVIGYRSYKLSEIKAGLKLGLFGFGASAHIVIQIANASDIDTYVFTRSKNHQKHALELGAKWVGTSKDTPPDKVDSAIIFAPAGSVVIDALKNLDKAGTLAINAVFMSDIPSIKYYDLYYEKNIKSVANVTPQDARDFLKLASQTQIHTTTTPYPLEKANEANIDMKHSKINGAAVLKF
ncbi:MAG: zinc-dependent alcohol dehydrogenase family protein [Promethearchaeota archaeon]